MLHHRSDKEMTDLATHVLLCQQRYEDVVSILGKQNKILYVVGAVVVMNLLGFTVQDIVKLLL